MIQFTCQRSSQLVAYTLFRPLPAPPERQYSPGISLIIPGLSGDYLAAAHAAASYRPTRKRAGCLLRRDARAGSLTSPPRLPRVETYLLNRFKQRPVPQRATVLLPAASKPHTEEPLLHPAPAGLNPAAFAVGGPDPLPMRRRLRSKSVSAPAPDAQPTQ